MQLAATFALWAHLLLLVRHHVHLALSAIFQHPLANPLVLDPTLAVLERRLLLVRQ